MLNTQHSTVVPDVIQTVSSYLTSCLLCHTADDPLDALHPHLQLHPPLVAPHYFHRLYLPQVANYPRPTSRSLGLAPCYSPHLQLLAFLPHRRHICTSLSLFLLLLSSILSSHTSPLTPLLLLLLSSNHYRISPPPPCAQPRPLTSPQPSWLMRSGI